MLDKLTQNNDKWSITRRKIFTGQVRDATICFFCGMATKMGRGVRALQLRKITFLKLLSYFTTKLEGEGGGQALVAKLRH